MLPSTEAALRVALDGPSPGVRWGDGCRRVFLDVGANIAVQTRKLYEPKAYPRVAASGTTTSGVHVFSWSETFAASWGDKRDDACAFAFEANVRHTPRLKAVEACYVARGSHCKIFTETAATVQNSSLTFYGDPVHSARQEVAASLIPHGHSQGRMPKHEVAAVDLAWWIEHHILSRRIPLGAGEPQVFMKLDIEGAEFKVLRRMIELNAFCGPPERTINLLVLETHLVFVSQVNGQLRPCHTMPECRDAQSLLDQLRAQVNSTYCNSTRIIEEDDNQYEFDSPLALKLDDPTACAAPAASQTAAPPPLVEPAATEASSAGADAIHTNGTLSPSVAAPPWQCNLFPALMVTSSCAVHNRTSCGAHYLRTTRSGPDGGADIVARCVYHDGACAAGAGISGCAALPSPAAMGAQLTTCIEAIGADLALAFQTRAEVSYRQRVKLIQPGIRRGMDELYAKLGYIGASACAMFQSVPITAARSAWVKYSLHLFDSFVCPSLVGDDHCETEPAGTVLPSGTLAFECRPGIAPSLVIRPGPGPYAAASTPARTLANERASWTSHVWGCGAAMKTASVTTFHLQPEVIHGRIRHTHLPKETCDKMRQAGLSQLRAHHQVHGYLVHTDPTDHGKHGMMHEFGEYYTRRILQEDEALSAAWELFIAFYVTPAPMHSFLSITMKNREAIEGVPILKWVIQWCGNYLRETSLLGAPSLSDPHQNLFGECAHGAGHGLSNMGLTPATCETMARDAFPTLPALYPDLIEADVPQLLNPSNESSLLTLWTFGCSMGHRHHTRNAAGRSSPFPQNASAFADYLVKVSSQLGSSG